MSTVHVVLRTPAGDETVELTTENEATFDDLYRMTRENTNLQVGEFRFVANGQVIEPTEAASIPVSEGEEVDVIREASNGS